MTSHPLPPHDEDDDQDLRALYRSLPRSEPGAKLDAAVRQVAARAAAADRNVQQPRRRLHPGWSVAATVVLVTGLFFLTDLNHPDMAGLSEGPAIDSKLATPPQTIERTAPAPAPAAPEPTTASGVAPTLALSAVPEDARASANKSVSKSSAGPAKPSTTSSADQSAAAEIAAAPGNAEPRIAHIRALLNQGKREKALQALQDLQRDIPDVTLPADLQQLLPKQP